MDVWAVWSAGRRVNSLRGQLREVRLEGLALRFEKTLLTVIAMSLMFGSTPAYAGKKTVEILNYWFVGATEDHTLFHFIDASTVTYDGPTRSAWVITIASGTGAEKYGLRRRMTFNIFNCQHNSSFESRVVTYDIRGENLLDHAYDTYDFRPIAAGSVEASELGFVCANPESWASGKSWTRIYVPPELMADEDNKAFSSHQAPR